MWHRTYWIYGRAWASAAGGYFQAGRLVPAARIMVHDDAKVWGYGRRAQYYRWTTPLVNHLFAANKQPEVLKTGAAPKAAAKKGQPVKKFTATQAPQTRFACEWSVEVPVQACAMALAGQDLFLAGPRELLSEDDAVKALGDPKVQTKLAEQEAGFDGKKGAILAVVSAADGKGVAAYRLPSLPIFDGLAAARGRLYLSSTDGKVLCLGAGEGQPLAPAPNVVVAPLSDAGKPAQ
jgi:hypothetical protein